jgi:hypothetical protein
MARGYFENVAFRLPCQVIIISVAPYEARAASLCESYAKFYCKRCVGLPGRGEIRPAQLPQPAE